MVSLTRAGAHLWNRVRGMVTRLRCSLIGRLVTKYQEDEGPTRAVVIAWNMLFAIFPIVLALITVLGLLFHLDGPSGARIREAAFTVIPDQAGREALSSSLPSQHRTGILAGFVLLGLLWSGSSLFGSMEACFARIHGIRPRPFWKQKLMSAGMILVFTLLLVISIGTSSVLSFVEAMPFLPTGLRVPGAAIAIQIVIGLVSGWILYGITYLVVPPGGLRLRLIWPGALLAGSLTEVLNLAFPTYINLTNTGAIGGRAFGFLLVLLTYLFFMATLIVLGAELNSLLDPAAARALAIPNPDVKAKDSLEASRTHASDRS